MAAGLIEPRHVVEGDVVFRKRREKKEAIRRSPSFNERHLDQKEQWGDVK